jgi:hypothetical protein
VRTSRRKDRRRAARVGHALDRALREFAPVLDEPTDLSGALPQVRRSRRRRTSHPVTHAARSRLTVGNAATRLGPPHARARIEDALPGRAN